MSRALFARGASWTNSLIFMVASTNLVIELGIVLYLLLGWQFVVAQFVGGALMVALLSFTTHYVFSRRYQDHLRERVLARLAAVDDGRRPRVGVSAHATARTTVSPRASPSVTSRCCARNCWPASWSRAS